MASVDLPEPFGPIRAWSWPGLDRQADAAQDLAVVDGDVQVVDLERGRVSGRRGGLLGHAGHCNNTTAVVEIYRVAGMSQRRGPARRPLRSPATIASPENSSSTRRRHAGGVEGVDPADHLDEVVLAVAAKAR